MVPNGDGTFTLNDDEGAGAGGHHASPLDLYLMGLIEASELPPIYVANPNTFDYFKKMQGEPITAEEIIDTVTADEIIALHGARTPGPAGAKKDFRLAFVAESNGRLLNPTELTYYEMMAAHFTKELPAGAPDPHLSHNWAPISRFFGHGTTWRSDLTLPAPPAFTVSGVAYLDRNANGVRDAGEAGLSRTIFIDVDGDRELDWSEIEAATAGDGTWSIEDLSPGTYEICQDFEGGFTTTPDDRCHTITVLDADVADVDFGSFPTLLEGTAGDDHFYVRRDATGSVIEIYLDGLADQPDYTLPPDALPMIRLMGREGDDLLTVDFANGNPLPSVAMLYFGEQDTAHTGGPGDRLEVLGAGQTFGSDQFAITLDGRAVGFNIIEGISIKDGTYNFTTPVVLIELHVDASATATFAGPHVFTTLNLVGDASVVPGTNGVLVAGTGVTVADGAVLDLQDSDLVIAAPPEQRQAVLDAITALVRRARNGSPRWSGSGITSSLAAANPLTGLAVMPNDDGSGNPLILNHPLLTGGQLNSDMVLVMHTWNGDANLDNRVNADDYFRIDSGFLAQATNPGYREGDFNYDGKVNADDYFLIDSAFLGQSVVLASAPASSVVARADERLFSREDRKARRAAPPRPMEHVFNAAGRMRRPGSR